MKEYELGKEGEQQARILLKARGFELQSPDWLGTNPEGKWICFEIKKKERFMPPPFGGHGLDAKQVYLRTKLFNETGIRTYLMIFEVPTGLIFGNYLDSLEQGEKFITKNNIIVYPLTSFSQI